MQVLTAVTPQNIANLLQEKGYLGKVDTNDDGCSVFTSAEGWGIKIRMYGQTPKKPDDIANAFQFWSFWKIESQDREIIIDACNAFNSEFRWVTTFVTTWTDCCAAELTQDHYCPDGVSVENFMTLLDNFVNTRRVFFERCREKYHEIHGVEDVKANDVPNENSVSH